MFVYLVYNTISGKLYVGISSNPETRWRRHKSTSKSGKVEKMYSLHHAMAKYGCENFCFKTVEECISWEECCQREREWIQALKETGYQLYNETEGGEGTLGRKVSDKVKKKMSDRHLGSRNPMYGKRLYGSANGNYGKSMKPHVKEALLKCRRKFTDEQITEIRNLYATGNHTQTSLAKQFGVSLTQLHRIVQDKSWGSKSHDEVLRKKNLTIEDVRSIRSLYAAGTHLQEELAKMYNCHIDHINKIINRKKWKNIK